MKFQVADREWTISEKYDNELLAAGHIGECRSIDSLLVLYSGLKKDMKQRTLRHEMVHCLLNVYNLDSDKKRYTEEELCEFVAIHMPFIDKIVKNYFKSA